MAPRSHPVRRLALAVALGAALTGCGSAASNQPHGGSATSSGSATAANGGDLTARPTQPAAVAELPAAEHPVRGQFPAAAGRSLIQLARLVGATAGLGAANGTFTPGQRRLAFALTDKSERFIYAPTAIYVAPSPSSPAEGPFLAPADPMAVAPQYRSAQNAGPGGLAAVYFTELPIPRSGIFDLLSLTRVGGKLIGATGDVAAALASPIPDVGQRPPDIATDTLASTHGKLSLLTTRDPPEDMHAVALNQVLGKRPVALLFSTPQLCASRVCGPVTDIMVELQHQFGSRISFIHQEVYADNNPSKGLRPQMRAFHLETEPWLFTINRQGIIVARLEGAFGVSEARQALEAALR